MRLHGPNPHDAAIVDEGKGERLESGQVADVSVGLCREWPRQVARISLLQPNGTVVFIVLLLEGAACRIPATNCETLAGFSPQTAKYA